MTIQISCLSSQLIHDPRHAAQQPTHPIFHLPVEVHLLHFDLPSTCEKGLGLVKSVTVAVVQVCRRCACVVAVGRGAGGKSLASGLMPQEAVSPNDFLPTQAALVGPQPPVGFKVLG